MGKIKQNLQVTTGKEILQLKNALGDIFISLIPHKHYIEAKWQGHLTAEDVITAAKAYQAYIKLHPCPKLLNDKSEITGEWVEANAWLEFEWLPLVLEAGLCCLTHVYSDDMLSQLSERDFFNMASPLLQMETFTDREQAISWLLACNPKLLAKAG